MQKYEFQNDLNSTSILTVNSLISGSDKNGMRIYDRPCRERLIDPPADTVKISRFGV